MGASDIWDATIFCDSWVSHPTWVRQGKGRPTHNLISHHLQRVPTPKLPCTWAYAPPEQDYHINNWLAETGESVRTILNVMTEGLRWIHGATMRHLTLPPFWVLKEKVWPLTAVNRYSVMASLSGMAKYILESTIFLVTPTANYCTFFRM